MSLSEYFTTDQGRLAIASFFGSAIAVALDWNGVKPAIRRLVVGTITAMYTFELALPITKMFLGFFSAPQEPSIALSGFLMGTLGVVFVETLLLAAKKFGGRFRE